MITYDFSKLRGKIIEVYGNYKFFSEEIGMDNATFSRKINNKVRFTHDELFKMARALKLKENEYQQYFFNHKTQ